MLASIVCVEKNNGIAKDNKLPWKFPEDMRYFRETTQGNVVIMGRKTYESIGKPLPNRRNIVLSKTLVGENKPFGVDVFSSVEEVLENINPDGQNFIIGGEDVYTAFLPYYTHHYISKIKTSILCDKFFPIVDALKNGISEEWVLIKKTQLGEGNDLFADVYEKRKRLFLDFDGVIHAHTTKFESTKIIPDTPIEGAIEKLKEYLKHFSVSIWSARNYYGGTEAIKTWLLEHGLTVGELSQISFPYMEKPCWHLYLCDNSQKFTGKFPSVTEIHNHDQWNKLTKPTEKVETSF